MIRRFLDRLTDRAAQAALIDALALGAAQAKKEAQADLAHARGLAEASAQARRRIRCETSTVRQ